MTSARIAIVDSGGANIASLQFALQRLAINSILTTNPDEISNSSHVILPGVGAAADAMARLRSLGLDTVIPSLQQPVLGICLGMQLLATASEEENTQCLGVIDGVATMLPATIQRPVPNMGWCQVTFSSDNPIFHGIDDQSYFYFVHSFALPVGDYTIATALHDSEFTAILNRSNFYGTQFHPERSAIAGAKLLQNFVNIAA